MNLDFLIRYLDILFIAELLIISIVDIRTMTIYSRSNKILLFLGFLKSGLFILYFDYNTMEWGFYNLCGSLLMAFIMALANLGKTQVFGGGDIRLVFVSGVYLGFLKLVISVAIGFICGGIFIAIGLMLGKIKPKGFIPLGPFLATGFLSAIILDYLSLDLISFIC